MIEKFSGFFDPTIVKHPIHIIGCGAIGSTLTLQLARCGLTDLYLWDFDIVESHNLANQQYRFAHIGRPKTECLKEMVLEINPHAQVWTKGKWIDDQLTGYVFLAVDNIELRKEIVTKQMYNSYVKAMFDFRMRLKDAQHYAADWKEMQDRKNFIATMQFTQAEADEHTPVNACNMALSIIPTVDTIVSVGVGNFINYLHGQAPERLIMANPFDMMIG